MAETVFCTSCGTEIRADAKFCRVCGSQQTTAATPGSPAHEGRQAGPPEQAPAGEPHGSERTAGETPAAVELIGQLAQQFRTAGVSASILTGVFGALVVYSAAILVASVFPDDSAIGGIGDGAGLLSESARHAVQFLLTGFLLGGEGPLRSAPAIFVLIPVGACAVGAAFQAQRTVPLAPRVRLLWGAATGIPFALLMLIPALAVGDIGLDEFTDESSFTDLELEPSIAGTLFLGFLWGALGGVLGTLWRLRRDTSDVFEAVIPPWGRTPASIVWTALKPFGIALLVGAAIVTGIWIAQTIRDEGDVRDDQGTDRSLVLALAENSLYAADHGVHAVELGAQANFHAPRDAFDPETNDLPLPIGSGKHLFAESSQEDLLDDLDIGLSDLTDEQEAGKSFAKELFANPTRVLYAGSYQLFDYRKDTEPYVFIPLLILLTIIPVFLAIYAGFAVARIRQADSPLLGAGLGALVGPVWAIAAITANALVHKDVMGKASGDSVFVIFLFGGAVLGALGGLLAGQRTPDGRATHDAGLRQPTASDQGPTV
jgi:zinc ribbon protein